MNERRRHQRQLCEGPVRIEVGGAVFTGRMEEMSEGNCFFMSPAYQSAGSVLRLRFRHPEDGRRVEVEVMVMRVIPLTADEGGGFGLAAEWVSRLSSVDLDTQSGVTAVELDQASADFEISIGGDPDAEEDEDLAVVAAIDDVPIQRIRPARNPALPVPTEFWAGNHPTVQGQLREVSLAGIRIESAEPPAEGTIVNVRFRPEDGNACPAVTLFGAVAWARGDSFGLDIRGVFSASERSAWEEYTRSFFV